MNRSTDLQDYRRLTEITLGSEWQYHNFGHLKTIVGATDYVLDNPLDFDPVAEFWQRPERRVLLNFIWRHFRKWPVDAEDEFDETLIALATWLDSLRDEGKIEASDDLPYLERAKATLSAVRANIGSFPDLVHWDRIGVRRDHPADPVAAMLALVEDQEQRGFEEFSPGVGPRLRFYGLLGARSAEELRQRQRFFGEYRNALMSHNAYRVAGSQFFGPIVGNTPTRHFLEALGAWRDGADTTEAPLRGYKRNSDLLEDVSSNNVVRELWGFLNLHRQPFYNSRVREYLSAGTDPESATRALGEATHEWLDRHPDSVEQLAARFDAAVRDPKIVANAKAYQVRRWKNGSGSPFDRALHEERTRRATEVLSKHTPQEKAAILLHVTMDAVVYAESKAVDATPVDWQPPENDSFPSLRTFDRVWLYAPGEKARNWNADLTRGMASIDYPEIADLSSFDSVDDVFEALRDVGDGYDSPTTHARTCWRFAHEIQPGDAILARRGRGRIIGIGTVTGGYRRVPDVEFGDQVEVEWVWQGSHSIKGSRSLPVVTLTECSRRTALLQELDTLITTDEEESDVTAEELPYTRADALSDLFLPDDEVDEMLSILRRKLNLVLQGPPGVGKTFVAKRLAYLLMGARAPQRVQIVQFHQAYTYEQFVRGFRPDGGGGFQLENGPLYDFAETAKSDPDNAYVLIIDEINRGNLSKILGEAMMLLEADKRSPDWAVQLAYTQDTAMEDEEPFYLPKNLYVIGTMNTADRSLALVDYALRRRFSFVDLSPGFEHPRFERHLDGLPAAVRSDLRTRLRSLNRMIADDPTLGPGFRIGHSYFCRNGSSAPWGDDPEAWVRSVFRFEIVPLLREYWYDDPGQLDDALRVLGVAAV
jgi:hypothetical protein